MKSLNQRTRRIYSVLMRDLMALSRITRDSSKALFLDMNWYRFCLNEEEVQEHLYNNETLKRHINFVRIERHQIFNGSSFLTEDITGNNYKQVSFMGLNLWGLCKATIASNLSVIEPDLSNTEHSEEVRRIYGEASTGLKTLDELFSKLKPDGVFIFQGGVFDSRCVVEVARRLGINVVGIENSMVGGMVILDNLSGQILNRHSMARMGLELLETCEIKDKQRDEAFRIWKEAIQQKAEEHRTGGIDNPTDIRDVLSLEANGKILLLLGQVRTDASIILDSRIYPDPVDMIEAVAECVGEMKDVTLLVRLHPKELVGQSLNRTPYERMTYKALRARAIDRLPWVRIVEDSRFSTYALMEMATAGITITSQSGFEMCLLGKPVMVCGDAFYGNKGFTLDLGHRKGLKSMVKFLIKEARLTEEQHRRALDYLSLLMERHLFDRQLSLRQDRLLRLFLSNSRRIAH